MHANAHTVQVIRILVLNSISHTPYNKTILSSIFQNNTFYGSMEYNFIFLIVVNSYFSDGNFLQIGTITYYISRTGTQYLEKHTFYL